MAMMVEEMPVQAPQPMDVAEENPATPAKAPAPAVETGVVDAGMVTEAGKSSAAAEVETPPKLSQSENADEDAEDDSNEALGLQLYYLLLRALFKELELYAQPVEAGLLDAKKQMLVYHYAARLFELRNDVIGALQGDFSLTANLPAAYQKVTRKLRKKLTEQNQLERLGQLTEKHVFGHDHSIKFMESSLPAGAKEHCVWLREKPHAASDVLKNMTPFREVIKFNCHKNPLMLIEDHGMGLALTIEKTFPVAYLVVSPFLRKPEILLKNSGKSWQQLEECLSDHLMNFIADDSDGWRAFIQRRANMISKGSLTIIQRVLRLKPCKEGMDGSSVQALQDLQDEVEVLRERAKKAEEVAAKAMGKECLALEGKLDKFENKNIDLSVLTENLKSDKDKLTRDLEQKITEGRLLDERARLAEEAVAAQKDDVETLRLRCLAAQDRHQEAVAARLSAETKAEDAETRKKEAEEEARGKTGEAELLAGGVQEMLVEMKRLMAAKKAAVMNAETKEEAKKELTLQLAQATEKGAEAKQKELAAVASMQLKEETVERITASNINLRAEAAAAKDEVEQVAARAAALEVAKTEALADVAKAREELQVREQEMQVLKGTIDEQQAFVTAAKADLERLEEAERKSAEAVHAQVEMSAKLQVKVGEVESLTTNCCELNAEVAELTESAQQETTRAETAEGAVAEARAAAQQAAAEHEAQLAVKDRSMDSLMSSNVALRAEAAGAKTDAEQAGERMVAAQANEAQVRAEMTTKVDEIQKLQGTIDDNTKFVVAAKKDVEKAQKQKKDAELKQSEAEGKATEASKAEAEMAARLQIKNEEITNLATSCGSLSAEVTKLTSNLQKESDRAEAAESATQTVTAQLEVKARTVETMQADSIALRVSLAAAKDKADSAELLVLNAEKAASTAKEGEAKARTALSKNKQVVAELEATIADLRERPEPSKELLAEVAAANKEVEQARQETTDAQKVAMEARNQEAQATAKLTVKTREQEGLVNECVTLRVEAARLTEQAAQAEELAKEANLAKVSAEASLQFKTDDVERVCATNVELRAETISSQKQAEESEKRTKIAESTVEGAVKSSEHAQAELRGKVLATESMAAGMAAVRAEATAARLAEAAAKKAAADKDADVDAAARKVLAAHKTESQATAKLKVKNDEAARLTGECSDLRAEAALLRGKSESSAAAVKALAFACEKLKAELSASESKHDWSKLQEPVPELTIDDIESALTDMLPEATAETPTAAPAPAAVGRRLRTKGPKSRLEEAPAAAEVERPTAAASLAGLAASVVGSLRRFRSKTPEPPAQKRTRLLTGEELAAAAVAIDPANVPDAD